MDGACRSRPSARPPMSACRLFPCARVFPSDLLRMGTQANVRALILYRLLPLTPLTTNSLQAPSQNRVANHNFQATGSTASPPISTAATSAASGGWMWSAGWLRRLFRYRERAVDLVGAERGRTRADSLPVLLEGGTLLDRTELHAKADMR